MRSSPGTGASSMPSQADWIASLSPWPEEFGLGRMRTLLANLGDPQLAYPAIHVVGTNGKSTATRTIEALLLGEGLSVGATVSPHVRSWAERITVDGEEADFEEAIARVRPEAEAQDATQFETITAAAFAEFAARGVDVAVVEAGLGGRLDATNVLRSHVVLLTNVGLDHTDVLGETREEIAAEKLAVVQEGTVVVLPDREFEALAGRTSSSAARVRRRRHFSDGRSRASRTSHCPAGSSGAATSSGTARTTRTARAGLSAGCRLRTTCCASLFSATRTSTRCSPPSRKPAGPSSRRAPRTTAHSRPPSSAAERHGSSTASRRFADPRAALARAHELGGPVLVTGSLYLLADLSRNGG